MFSRHGHVRVQRVVLEDHGHVAFEGTQVVDDPPADAHLASGRLLQAGDDVERGRLAAAGRAQQGHELAVLDAQVHVLAGLHGAERAW